MNDKRIPVLWANNGQGGQFPIFEGGRVYNATTERWVTATISNDSAEHIVLHSDDGELLGTITRHMYYGTFYQHGPPSIGDPVRVIDGEGEGAYIHGVVVARGKELASVRSNAQPNSEVYLFPIYRCEQPLFFDSNHTPVWPEDEVLEVDTGKKHRVLPTWIDYTPGDFILYEQATG